MNLNIKPSYFSLFSTGFIILIIFILIIQNFSKMQKLETITLINLLSHFGILLGVHGLIHLGLEKIYGFNPMEKLFTSIKI
jgi:hypothetical protein